MLNDFSRTHAKLLAEWKAKKQHPNFPPAGIQYLGAVGKNIERVEKSRRKGRSMDMMAGALKLIPFVRHP